MRDWTMDMKKERQAGSRCGNMQLAGEALQSTQARDAELRAEVVVLSDSRRWCAMTRADLVDHHLTVWICY